MTFPISAAFLHRKLAVVLIACGLVGSSRTASSQDAWYRSYEQGVQAVEAGEWEEAARLLALSIEHGPEQGRSVRTYGVRFVDFLPGYYLGVAHYNLGEYDQALESLSGVLDNRLIEPGDDEFEAANELYQRAQVALRASRATSPSGETSAAEDVAPAASRGAVAVTSSAPAYGRGRYVALVIGNAEYEHFPELSTPIGDAKALATLLENQYGFETRLIENASRADILDGVDETMSQLSQDDSLLIFYAGHGILDDEANEGYWLPVTAEPDRRSNVVYQFAEPPGNDVILLIATEDWTDFRPFLTGAGRQRSAAPGSGAFSALFDDASVRTRSAAALDPGSVTTHAVTVTVEP